MQVRSLTKKDPVVVAEDATVQSVAQLMNTEVVGAVVVTRDGAPVGIVTDRDLVVRVVARWGLPSETVRQVMTSEVITIRADADSSEALHLFEHHGFRRLPLVEQGKLVGMVTLDDIVIDLVAALGRATGPIADQVRGEPEPEPIFNS